MILKKKKFFSRACRYGNKKVAVTLLDRGCTPCLRNARGVTPLHLACQYRHMDIAKVIEPELIPETCPKPGFVYPHYSGEMGCYSSIFAKFLPYLIIFQSSAASSVHSTLKKSSNMPISPAGQKI